MITIARQRQLAIARLALAQFPLEILEHLERRVLRGGSAG
jgi:ABC-type transport system involved in cytochrome c biogenesis ATPase subunit